MDLTVGDLRAKLADLPDDMPVMLVDHYDEASPTGSQEASVMIVRPQSDHSRTFDTWFTPEEFLTVCCDETGAVTVPYSEKDRPPADGIRAFTLWH